MSYTTTDLALAVLRKLRVIDASETESDVEAAVLTQVTDAWRAKWEQLSSHGVELTYFNYDAIPNPVFLILVDLMANEMRPDFGTDMSQTQKEQEELIILRRLRRHTMVQSTGKQTQTRYF